MAHRIPVGRPFPDVADHVEHAVAVGRIALHRRRARPAVARQVLVQELALPGVGHVPAARRELVAPGELHVDKPAARRELPLGFGRDFLAGPSGVGLGASRRPEDEAASLQHLRLGPGIVLGVGRNLGPGDMAGRLDEAPELRVGDRCGVDPEAVDRNGVRRRFFRIMVARAHAESAAGNPNHVGGHGRRGVQHVHRLKRA